MAWLKSNLLNDEPVGRLEQEGNHSFKVVLKGRISIGDQLDPIWSQISTEQPPQVTVDLGDVDSFGSSAIGSLLRFANALYQRGGLASIVRCPNNILLSLGNTFEIEQSLPIRSVRVDFLCRSCDAEIAVDFDLTPSLIKDMTRARGCTCGGEFELDVLLFPYEGLQGLVQTMATTPADLQEPGGAPDLTGATLQGVFEILEVIGTGGFSTVYRARQVGMDRFVAIKVMSNTTPSMAAQFRDEAKIISQLAHPNVVTVFSFGELSDDSLYLAMELVQGPTLRRVLSAGPLRPLVRLLQLAREALLGVNAAHEEGIVHRDIKPENLMLASSQGRETLKVLDFGLATAGMTTGPGQGREGSLSGTPAYVAPELWVGIPASETSDQFALGLVIREMLMGSMLTRSKSDLAGNASRSPSAGYDDAVAQLLDPIIARMTEVDPENRFPNLLSIIEELDEILLVAGGGPAVAYVPEKRESHRSRLWLVGPSQATVAYGQEVVCHSADISEPSHAVFDQVVLNVSDKDWQTSWREVQRHVRPNIVLPVIAGAVDSSAASAVSTTDQGVLGVDSGIAGILLESMASEGTISPGELLTPGGKYLQLTSLEHKQLYLSILEESLTAGRVRSSIRHRIVQLADELILNAFYYSDDQRKTTQPMRFPTGKAGLLRWLVRDDEVVISVRDAYGSLRAFDLVSSLQSLHAPKRPKVREVGGMGIGMGMGIPMTINSSKAVVFQVLSGERTEVSAIFAKERLSDPSGNCVGWMFRNQERVAAPRGRRITTIGETLWYEESPTEGGLRISLRGHVGESANLFKVFNHQGTVILDLGQVTGINSFGVRNWCAAHEQRSPFLKLEILNCAPTLLDTYSLVGEIFIRASEIRSVIVPFICDRCDIEISEGMTVESLSRSLAHQPIPLRHCTTCRGVLELDRLPESYFRFLQPS